MSRIASPQAGSFPLAEPDSEPVRLVEVANNLVGYVGSFTLLLIAALSAPLRRSPDDNGIVRSTYLTVERLLVLAIPLLSLLHVAFGSILAMQAFFRATFPETNGAVVGVGLVRSVAPLLTGLTIAIIMAVCTKNDWLQNTTRARGDEPDAGHFVLPRFVGAILAAPLLALWGACVGTLMGCLVSSRVLGVASGTYFGFFFEMLQVTDVIGLVVLSACYSCVATLLACHEAVRNAHGSGASMTTSYRAVLLSIVAILLVNSLWFSTIYLSQGPGPVVIDAPKG